MKDIIGSILLIKICMTLV